MFLTTILEPFIYQLVTPIIFTPSFLHYSIFLSYFKVCTYFKTINNAKIRSH